MTFSPGTAGLSAPEQISCRGSYGLGCCRGGLDAGAGCNVGAGGGATLAGGASGGPNSGRSFFLGGGFARGPIFAAAARWGADPYFPLKMGVFIFWRRNISEISSQ